jgi:tetratricopeptide (TPR) repeat protein
MRLSLCMIVKDEAANLPRCLASVESVVDEIVVLDTGSQDATIAIAQKAGAIVRQFSWPHDFSIARNRALQYVTGDWVLVLDADEALAPSIGSELRHAIELDEDYLVFNLLRHEIGADQAPYSLVSRLFRRHPAIEFRRPYHAMIDDSVEALRQIEPHWRIGNIEPVAIEHYGYQAAVIAGRNKLTKARSMMEGFLAKNPQDPYVCNKLGALYCEMGDRQQGIRLLERGLRAESIDPHTKYELLYHSASAVAEYDEFEAAEFYQQALQQPIAPKLKIGALNNFAAILEQGGRLDEAQALYEQVIEHAPDLALAHCNLGLVLSGKKQLPAAIAAYKTAIALKPDYADAHQSLGAAYLKNGEVDRSMAAFRRAIDLRHSQGQSDIANHLIKVLGEMGFTP